MFIAAVARTCFAIGYVLPVLWTTSCFHEMALWRVMCNISKQRQRSASTYRDLCTGSEVCYLRLPRLIDLGGGFGGWRLVERIDAALSRFLCPRSAADETAADHLARRLVGLVVDVCRRRRGVDRCRPPAVGAVVTSAFVGRPSMFCRTTAARVRATWLYLAEVLARVPAEHLHSVLALGFCLDSAPRTHDFGGDDGPSSVGAFVVCHGANEPNSTLVTRHTPSDVELDVAMRSFDRLTAVLLRRLEGGRRRRAVLVTVSRSVRDGYTPRSLAGRIEAGILTSLRRQRRSGAMTVVYDKDLLGGREGWMSRP